MYINWLDYHPDKVKVIGSSPIIPTVLVAQMVRVLVCGTSGHGFKSHLTPFYLLTLKSIELWKRLRKSVRRYLRLTAKGQP